RAAEESIILRDKEIIDNLREKSDPDTIPIDSMNPKPVEVKVENSLLYVVTADPEAEVVEIVLRQKLIWRSPSLAWSNSKPDVDNVSIPLRYLWSPDTAPTNGVSVQEPLSPEIAVVSADGEITYAPQMRVGIHADLKGLSSSAGVRISFTLESWTYDNTRFRFASPASSNFDLEEFESKRYKVSDAKVEKRTKWHPSRPSLHESLEFSFLLKRIE
ncbi:unnamed protein product, partial [Candidula unifasciata]